MLLLLLLLHFPAMEALPVPALTENQEAPSPSCDDINNCRTLWNIILGCLTTVFLCTWVAIHPNIPEPIDTHNKNAIQKFLHGLSTLFSERIPMFACMLLVPDYVLAWAVRQRLEATNISKMTGWSKTHGFFIIMGGFHFFERTQSRHDYGEPSHPLTKADVIQLFGTETIQFSADVEIKDDGNPTGEPKGEAHPSILNTKGENPAVVETKDGESPVAESPGETTAATKTKDERPAVGIKDDKNPAAAETKDRHSAMDTKEDENPVVVEIKDESKHPPVEPNDENPVVVEAKENQNSAVVETNGDENSAVVEAKDEHTAVNTKNNEDPVATETKAERPAVDIQDQFPAEVEIQDKSKSDWLAKALVVIQTLWFITQCIARGFARLPVTKLELVTLAYTAMNIGIYLAWWHKPYDVTSPIRVFTNLPKRTGTGVTERLYYWADPNSELQQRVERASNYMIGSQDRFTIIHQAKKVPAFYSGDPDNRKIFIADAITLLVGIVFGAIHLIGWSFEFSSSTELFLWRISSIAITGVPLFFVAAGGIQTRFRTNLGSVKSYMSKLVGVRVNGLLNILATGIAVLLVILYIISRLTTLILAFTTLHSLPPRAYQAVQWTNIIPHI